MSRTRFHPGAILAIATITAALFGTACSDSTGPASEEGSAGASPTTQLPGDTSATPAGSHAPPAPAAGEAPKVNWQAPGDTTTPAPEPNFLLRHSAWRTEWATAPGPVGIPQGAALCTWLPTIPQSRQIQVAGIKVGATGGKSAYFDQYVTAEVWFYRSNGTAWVPLGMSPANASMPGYRTDGALSTAKYPASLGSYKVVIRFTWWARLSTGWIQTAGATYDFNARAEYQGGLGASAGPGYCTITA